MKRILLLMLLMSLFIIGASVQGAQLECTDEIGCVEIGPDDPITLGYMLTTSGATSFLGEDSLGGIEIAIAGWDGMVLDHEIELVGEDSLCSAEGGQTAAQNIASNENVVAVIGTNCSSASVPAIPIISDAGLTMISPSATNLNLTNPDTEAGGTWQPGFFRTAHNDRVQGAVAAQFAINELGATTLATIHDGSPYADGLQAVMADTFAELGGEVVFQGAVNVGDTDMNAILTEIATNPPDLLYFPIFEPEGNFIAAQTRTVPGLEDTILMGADGILVDSFPEATGEAAIGMYFSGPYLSSETYDEFLATWEEEIGGVPPSVFHAHAYDATNILLQAIEEVAQVGDDGTILIGRQALRDAVSATENFEGLTGVLNCGDNETLGTVGDCATGEALGIFQMTEAEVNEGNWPPPIVWTPALAAEEDM